MLSCCAIRSVAAAVTCARPLALQLGRGQAGAAEPCAAHGLRAQTRALRTAVRPRALPAALLATRCFGPPRRRALQTSSAALAAQEVRLGGQSFAKGITEAQLMEWHVKEGDTVRRAEPICSVETDKTIVEVTSSHTGIVTKLHYQEQDEVKVGAILMDLDTGDSRPTALAGPPAVHGSYVVDSGSRAAIWGRDGALKIVDGPARLFLWGSRAERLRQYVASPLEYLEVSKRSGTKSNHNGPVSMWLDPAEHRRIMVKPAVILDAGESLVTYQSSTDAEGGMVHARQLRTGPTTFKPASGEWVHEFRWLDHRTVQAMSERKKHQFKVLRSVPLQMPIEVKQLRTADNAELSIVLVVLFQMIQIEQMLDTTHDPISDLVVAITADIAEFVASRTFDELRQATVELSTLVPYCHTALRAEQVGFKVLRVTFRRLRAGATIQQQLDSDVAHRLSLKHKQEQTQSDAELEQQAFERELQRQDQRRLATDRQHEDELRRRHEAWEQRLRQRAEERQSAAGEEAVRDERRLRYFRGLRDLGVDLTQMVVHQARAEGSRIRITADPSMQIHTHLETKMGDVSGAPEDGSPGTSASEQAADGCHSILVE